MLAEEPPFYNLFGYATLLAEDGREMHKSWGNSIEFNEAADTMGADTMRWLYAARKPEQNLLFGYTKGDETRRRFLIPLWNVYAFLVSYARLDGWLPGAETAVSPNPAHVQMDKWIVERLQETALLVRAALDKYDAERATRELEAFLDDLSNWYVRRSRRRFWKSEADDDKTAAYATLYRRPRRFHQAAGPVHPLRNRGHVPEPGHGPRRRRAGQRAPHPLSRRRRAELDQRLLAKMRLAITTASLGRAARGSADIKLRQPLAEARVNVGSQQEQDDLLELLEVLKEEINVKDIRGRVGSRPAGQLQADAQQPRPRSTLGKRLSQGEGGAG